MGESFYLSSQGMSEWPTLDECKQAGRRAVREIDHRITDWQYRDKAEWTPVSRERIVEQLRAALQGSFMLIDAAHCDHCRKQQVENRTALTEAELWLETSPQMRDLIECAADIERGA